MISIIKKDKKKVLKLLKEEIKVLKKVKNKHYDQDIIPIEASYEKKGCAMHHYPKSEDMYNILYSYDLAYMYNYIHGLKDDIKYIAEREGWKIPKSFKRDDAINRIKFIRKKIKKL